jgi:hypothetical protein
MAELPAGITQEDVQQPTSVSSFERSPTAFAARTPVRQPGRSPRRAALRMIHEAIGELFGPIASIESEEAVLRRGPQLHNEAEAIIAAPLVADSYGGYSGDPHREMFKRAF